MKKVSVLALFFALTVLAGVVFAAGGDSSDPLISLSYLQGTFRDKVDRSVDNKLDSSDKAAYAQAESALRAAISAAEANVGGNVADTFVVFAMTDKTKGNHGISAFIVEKSFPGFSTGKHEKKMGIRGSSTCDLIFEDCVVPKENLLGKEGKGFKIAMQTLDGGRIGIASQALGLGEGAVNEAIKYTQERVQFGRRLSQFQNTQFQLADMHTRTQAAQYLVYAAAMKKQNHEDYSMDAAMAKLFAAETASDVTRRAVQLFGGYGYTREYPVERMMRDAKITEIYEGTSEVQRMVVAKYLGVN